ncbi:hypothetical protein I6N96_11120 [Enterococcus sp. BWM-S5]|uniref:Uncharacterized protein n=1 Tax=Enterococcus larvae TaxID=2794352 RepID=A0ABS4CJM1_9ENTE|nr:hypothetical protein [Enterococcus larvae]MBP1046818.1 hypothetical protein [Enterococcus larvae]
MKKQEQLFTDYMMDETLEEHKEEMKTVLQEMTQRKHRGELDKAYLAGIMPRLFSYLNPDKVAEAKGVIETFSK